MRWRLAQALERVAPAVMSCRIRAEPLFSGNFFTYIKQVREQQTFSRARLFLGGTSFPQTGYLFNGFSRMIIISSL